MASYPSPSLSIASGGEVYVGSEIRDSLSLLDVLHANEFEGQYTDPDVAEQTEVNFYRGAPPEWLNFHIVERAKSKGTGTLFIKRDGYDELVDKICKKRRGARTSMVKLLHQPGSGGTTLAMQVLWDFRKKFRSAVLTGPTLDLRAIANQVIHLFTAGGRSHQNTVLLLVHDEQILDSLQDSIMIELAEQQLVTYMPVVILLNCVRKTEIQECDYVVLKKQLSDTEKQKFEEKKEELSRRYSDKHEHFHGFNIMQTNFSQAYVQEACAVFKELRRTKKPRRTQLATFLALLNAYVPGSYLLESQCLDFLRHQDSVHGELSLEVRMEHFGHLIITFSLDRKYERKVCMAHPMIAQSCVELMDEADVTRSDTAIKFLSCLCEGEVPPRLLGFVKDMLTKREMKNEENQEKPAKRWDSHEGPMRREEEKERFSRLILDIQKMEADVNSASVLKSASRTFVKNPYFPQALARFYYLELKDYTNAELWAKRAKERDPKKSFIADTLGQVHKHHLKNKASPDTPREMLQLATWSIEAFREEEELAENEQGSDMKEDGMTKVSHSFNNRGMFGYLQVANIVYDLLVTYNKDWRDVLTKNASMESCLKSLGDKKLLKFSALISSLRDEVERKCTFFFTYLSYTRPGIQKDDPPYIWSDVCNCYQNYVGDSPPKHVKQNTEKQIQKLKEKLAVTFPGLLSCLDRKHTVFELEQITTRWREICSSKHCMKYNVHDYILANIMLHNMGEAIPTTFQHLRDILEETVPLSSSEAPEHHMVALLLFWPQDRSEPRLFDLSDLIQQMNSSYGHSYEKHFRSRYHRPLFFLGKGDGLSRIVHRSILDNLVCEGDEDAAHDLLNKMWSNDDIFKNLRVRKRLLQVEGVVRNYRVYATFGAKEVEVGAHLRDSIWKSRPVSFYLGFTIRGPVAFDIQEKPEEGSSRSCTSCGGVQDSSHWTHIEPDVRVDGVPTYSLQSEAGRFECSVSALRWVCQEKVSFYYQFSSWEKHKDKLEIMHYTPGGPLLDVTVLTGKFDEVYLPHWICPDRNLTISTRFAVLHIDDTCGESVEQAADVTPSHVKLLQPVFSPKGVLIRAGFPCKVHCNMLIYKTDTAPLTLHVYLIPCDPAVQQAIEKKEKAEGYKTIRKPNPEKSLQMQDRFILTSDVDSAEICPEHLKLRYETSTPNFFEVFIRNASMDFRLKLESDQKRNKEKQIVWTCKIRKDEYQKTNNGYEQASHQHFVDRHRAALIERVCNPGPILDKLKDRKVISDESYDAVRAEKTTQNQMRAIFKFLRTAGTRGKDALYEILKKVNKYLVEDLEESQGHL